MPDLPPTIIVVHPKERRSKCTVEPLRGRPEFEFWKYPRVDLGRLDGYVQLGLDGEALSPVDADRGLLVLDGTWKLAAGMQDDFAALPVRTLPPWKTAYPRVSKIFDDPAAGLATIEAIFLAYQILGRDTTGLLDAYYWRDEFLRLNGVSSGDSAC